MNWEHWLSQCLVCSVLFLPTCGQHTQVKTQYWRSQEECEVHDLWTTIVINLKTYSRLKISHSTDNNRNRKLKRIFRTTTDKLDTVSSLTAVPPERDLLGQLQQMRPISFVPGLISFTFPLSTHTFSCHCFRETWTIRALPLLSLMIKSSVNTT